jgi:hypothetical protein
MNKSQLAVLSAALLVVTQAGAIDLGNGVSFKAFGTLGLVHSNNSEADYVTSTYTQRSGAGFTDATSYKVDSKLGAQLDWQASEKISFSTQLLSKQYEDDTWTPRIESGFLRYEVAPELDVRVGRIHPPVFNLSDFLDVNYANPWVRPPIEHYAIVPFSYIDGADLLWRTQSEEVSWLVQPYIGQAKMDNALGDTNDASITGLNVRAGHGDFTFRAGYALDRFQVTGDTIDYYLVQLRVQCQVDPVACDIMDQIDSKDSKATYLSLGGSWDNGDYFILGEWGKSVLNVPFFPEMQSWYLSGGARIESWTPYISFARAKDTSPIFDDSVNSIPNDIVNTMHNGIMQGQHTIALGVRYDFMPNMALKAQWDHIKTDCRDSQAGTCGGVFVNHYLRGFGTKEPQEADVISLSIDFIY